MESQYKPGSTVQNQGDKPDPRMQIFFANLPFGIEQSEVQTYFSKFGTIKSTNFIKDRVTQKPKGYGFVTFENETSVDECQKNRPHVLQDKTIDTRRCFRHEYQDKPYFTEKTETIYIGGIKDETMTESDIRTYFSSISTNIKNINLRAASQKDMKKGWVFLSFEDFDDADRVINSNPHNIKGVSYEVKKALKKETMTTLQNQQMGAANQNMMQNPMQQMMQYHPYGMPYQMPGMMPFMMPFGNGMNPFAQQQKPMNQQANPATGQGATPQANATAMQQQMKPGYAGYPGVNQAMAGKMMNGGHQFNPMSMNPYMNKNNFSSGPK